MTTLNHIVMKNLLLSIAIFIPAIIYAQVGKVGINTTIPRAMLHVKDSSVLFTGAGDINLTPGPTPISNAGVRMMWYPDKAAFRVGRAALDEWNRENIGYYSFASGQYVMASGYASNAIGTSSMASGFGSTTLGNNLEASGEFATAIGHQSIASALNSTALGYNATANGHYANSFGAGTIANGFASFVTGLYNDEIVDPQNAINDNTPLFVVGNGYSDVQRSNALVLKYNGDMGIGTNNPLNRLHVMKSLPSVQLARFSSDGGYGEIVVDNGSNEVKLGTSTQGGYVGTNYAQDFYIRTNNQPQMTIEWGSGNVGIGVTDPDAKLDVKQLDANSIVAQFKNLGGYSDILVGNPVTSAVLGAGYNDAYVGTKENTDFRIISGDSDCMIIKSETGYVGIGTDNPTEIFHVHVPDYNVNLGRFSCTGGYGQIMMDNSITELSMGVWDGLAFAGTQSESDFMLRTGALERIRIQHTTGNVGIGTSAPAYKLEVNGSAAKPGGGSWVATSDARLKQNVVDYTDGLSSLLHIRPVTYQYNSFSGYDTNQNHIGVIAQELQEVAPYMVSTSGKVAENGNAKYLEVDNSAMTYMLINAVKEQHAIIENLERRIDQLEGKE